MDWPDGRLASGSRSVPFRLFRLVGARVRGTWLTADFFFWLFLCQAEADERVSSSALLHASEMPGGHVLARRAVPLELCMRGVGGMLWEVRKGVWSGGGGGVQAQGVVVMTMTWVWTDGVQLMMNNYASFFFFNIVVLFLAPPVVKIVTSPLISWCSEKQEPTLMNGD